MVGIRNRPLPAEATWPTNVALVCLGAAITWIAFRFLHWNDPRPIFNPWFYAVTTPVCLLLLSLVLRGIVSRVVERSAQAAFLLSVIVHLLLLVAAMDIVLPTRMWNALFEAIDQEKKQLQERERNPPLYFNLASSANPSRRRSDFLRSIPTQHDAHETELKEESELQLARSDKTDLVTPVPKMEPAIQPFLIERQEPSQLPAASHDAPSPLSRAELSKMNPTASRAQSVEAIRPNQIPELMASSVGISRSRRGESDLPPAAAAPQEPTSIGSGSIPMGLPRSAARDHLPEPGLLAIAPQKRDKADYRGPSMAPQNRSVPLPEMSGVPTSSPPTLAPASGSSGKSLRRADNSGNVLGSAEPTFQPGMTSAEGLGNISRSSLAGTIGNLDGRVDGAGVDHSSFSLPRGELGASSTNLGNGRIDVPDLPANGAGNTGAVGSGVSPSNVAAGGRGSETGGPSDLQLAIQADLGPGGISLQPGAGPLLARSALAAPALDLPSLDVSRFAREAIGGPLAGGMKGPVPTPAFQQRIDRLKDDDSGQLGPQTELAIERGLEFLSKHQRPEGHWRLQDLDKEVLIRSDTAATGLCLLAFQGAGYTHRQYKYADANARALKYLIARQRPNGDLYIPQDPASDQNAWLYSHGIAALALCEAYGMTQDPELRGPAQMAVKFMVDSQEPTRGGWRYRPGVGSDTSVTGWFMMALKSAQLAGLDVPQSAFNRMSRFLQASQVSAKEPHLFRYNPFAPDTVEQRHGLKPTHIMTSVGLLMRLYLGWKRDLPEMQTGTDYILTFPPEIGTADATKRDTYYWYYATQVLFHMGGDRWKQWNQRLRPLLLNSQVVDGELAGSWDPYLPSADLWARYGGRLYVTTLNLLSLEVHYRHLPLYEATAK